MYKRKRNYYTDEDMNRVVCYMLGAFLAEGMSTGRAYEIADAALDYARKEKSLCAAAPSAIPERLTSYDTRNYVLMRYSP